LAENKDIKNDLKEEKKEIKEFTLTGCKNLFLELFSIDDSISHHPFLLPPPFLHRPTPPPDHSC
jgi:hypothetical protein